MLSNSQPFVNNWVRSDWSPKCSKCKSWAALNVKACVTSKLDGPLSACVSNGSCGLNSVTAPVDPVPPRMPLTSSRDLPQVYPACNDGPPCPTFPDNEVCKALYEECDVAVITDSNPNPPVTTPLPLKSVNRANSESAPGYAFGYDILGSRNADVPTYATSAVRPPKTRSSPNVQVCRNPLPKRRSIPARLSSES